MSEAQLLLMKAGVFGPLEADQVHPRHGYLDDEPGDEVEGVQYDVRGAIPVESFELVSENVSPISGILVPGA